MADSPWVKWFTSDFLGGIGSANLKADEIGVYTVILSLIADRGAPIDNDRAWIAGKAGTSTRRCNQIVDRLIAIGKLEVRRGLLGNARMIREIKKRDGKSDQARAAAFARWHNDDQPELPIEGGSGDYPRIKSRKTEEHIDLKSGKNGQKPQKSANSDDADASPTRARARPRDSETQKEEEESSPAANPKPRVAQADADADLPDLLGITHRLCRMGGVSMVRPSAHKTNMDIVKHWIAEGIDIEAIVIPAIEAQFKDTRETTIGSLSFYGARVARDQARAVANGHGPPTREWTAEEQAKYLASLK